MRSNSLKREMTSNIRWCFSIIAVAMMAAPMLLTNDVVAISVPHTVQAICISLAGMLLLHCQVQAAFSLKR